MLPKERLRSLNRPAHLVKGIGGSRPDRREELKRLSKKIQRERRTTKGDIEKPAKEG